MDNSDQSLTYTVMPLIRIPLNMSVEQYQYHVTSDKMSNGTYSIINHLFDQFMNESKKASTEDYYEYDYDESVNSIAFEEAIPVSVVYGITLLLGLIGNVFVIISILRYRRMQTVTNIFLTSLASADLLLVLLCVPIKVSG